MEIRPDNKYVTPYPDEGALSDDPSRDANGEGDFKPFSTFVFSLARFGTLAGFICAALGSAVVTIWVADGATPVRDAARDTYTAENNWFANLEQTQSVIQELNARGAPRDDIETVYFAFVDATPTDRPNNADVLLQVLQDQTVAVRSMGHRVDHIAQMLYPPTRARAEVTSRYQEWVDATTAPSARIAIAIGIAPSPDQRYERYARGPRVLRARTTEE